MREMMLWVGLVVVLVCINVLILDKEKTLAEGELILLELAPRDPRSLLQGDFMALRYQMANQVLHKVETRAMDGNLVIALNDQNVARFARMHTPEIPLAENERLLRFRKRGQHVRIAGDAFFFQEGHGRDYQNAHYGELRVDASGKAILTGLRDRHAQALKPE
ncbi:hypothetical protein C2W62_26895 [Candidatus Entotheonella serta]|nr:hypothetical protein C2W62_26895 [Candidatus Entotheonella serta]